NAFSAPSRDRSRHSSTLATVNPCFRAVAWAEVSPFRMLRIKDARRFAVQRWGDSGLSSAMAPPPAVIQSRLVGGLNSEPSSIPLYSSFGLSSFSEETSPRSWIPSRRHDQPDSSMRVCERGRLHHRRRDLLFTKPPPDGSNQYLSSYRQNDRRAHLF